MSKNMQKIVLFIEPNQDTWITPNKISDLIMNRFEENAKFKIVKIFALEKSYSKLPFSNFYPDLEEERNKKGMNLSTLIYL